MNEKIIGKKHFLISDEIQKALNEIPLTPEHEGLLIAKEVRDKLVQSPNNLSNLDLPKIEIEGKAEWNFICGKEARAKAHLKGEFLVINKDKDIIGIGKRSERGIKPVIDIGDFLRRES